MRGAGHPDRGDHCTAGGHGSHGGGHGRGEGPLDRRLEIGTSVAGVLRGVHTVWTHAHPPAGGYLPLHVHLVLSYLVSGGIVVVHRGGGRRRCAAAPTAARHDVHAVLGLGAVLVDDGRGRRLVLGLLGLRHVEILVVGVPPRLAQSKVAVAVVGRGGRGAVMVQLGHGVVWWGSGGRGPGQGGGQHGRGVSVHVGRVLEGRYGPTQALEGRAGTHGLDVDC